MSTSTKKTVSKWFRVAVSGATTDGRVIQASWISQMAETFKRETYGARIWLEHIRGISPDSSFKAYGDVIEVKAEKATVNGEEKLCLFAKIEPTEELVAMSKAKQKIYTSIEINENFADTGKCYLVGLAVTDSPASLGTDILTFASQNPNSSPFTCRKQDPKNVFTAAEEVNFEFETIEAPAEENKFNLSNMVKDLFNKNKKTEDQAFSADLKNALTQIVEHADSQAQQFADQDKELKAKTAELKTLSDNFTQLQKDFSEFKTRVENETITPARPPSTGGTGDELTNC